MTTPPPLGEPGETLIPCPACERCRCCRGAGMVSVERAAKWRLGEALDLVEPWPPERR